MKLVSIRVRNFQCFGPDPVTVPFEHLTFLLGPNGAGKTACLQAISRMFCTNPSLRTIRASDFHAPTAGDPANSLFVEATFELEETSVEVPSPTVADHYDHMRLENEHGLPQVRYRLESKIAPDEVPDTSLSYVLEVDESGEPTKTIEANRLDRNRIHVHYMPARRNPADQVSYGQASLLGKILRAASWDDERAEVKKFTAEMNSAVLKNASVRSLGENLAASWGRLHRGEFFRSPTLSFLGGELDSLLQYVSIGFGPAHGEDSIDYVRLSDGQQSLLYLSLVISTYELGRKVLAGNYPTVDVNKLRPPTFTMILMEEPENSLSPHSLGRVIKTLESFTEKPDAQAVVATHSPAMLRRAAPESVRHLRLRADRTTTVSRISLPDQVDEAHKYVRHAVQAYPELYFARMVILGEGETEEVVIPRLLEAHGLGDDESSITVTPLGGRHVNHFWRLLNDLGIPHVTLLDLDTGRFGGGWGRVRYALKQLGEYSGSPEIFDVDLSELPHWTDTRSILNSWLGRSMLELLERHGVFFSSPLDLDLSMMVALPDKYTYRASREGPEEDVVRAVLGKGGTAADEYPVTTAEFFAGYHEVFQLGSKPAAHLVALADIDRGVMRQGTPASLRRLLESVRSDLGKLPE